MDLLKVYQSYRLETFILPNSFLISYNSKIYFSLALSVFEIGFREIIQYKSRCNPPKNFNNLIYS